MTTSDAEVREGIRRLAADARTKPIQPPIYIVHPRVYAQRETCPEWTNRPNPDHVHNDDCIGLR